MIDFIRTQYFMILYGITLMLALFTYPKYYDSSLKYFPVLIIYTLCTEILGWFILTYEEYQVVYRDLTETYAVNNAVIYNIFDIVFYGYFFYLYYRIAKSEGSKRTIIYGVIAFVIMSIINLFIQSFWLLPQVYAICIGSIVLIICIVNYLEELRQENKTTSYQNNLLLWISIGLLLFYPLYPIFIIVKELYIGFYSNNLRTLHLSLIAAMYICFSIGFIRLKRFR